MKLNVKFLLVLFAASMMMYSCSHQAGEDDPVIDQGTLEFISAKEFLDANAPSPQVFSVTGESGGTFTTSNGYRFQFYPNSFSLNGQTATGPVNVEITEVLTPMDMMLTGATTTTASAILESGGMFKIEVKQNGDALRLRPGMQYQVTIPGDFDGQMQLFQGIEKEDRVEWAETQDSSWVTGDSAKQNYIMTLDFLEWCNLDKFVNEPNQTKVRVKLPDGYTNKNTSVFMVFKQNMVTPLFGDAENKEFGTGEHYTAPEGWSVKFVVIAVKDKKLYYAIVDSKITKDHLENITNLTETTEDDLKKILEGLK